MAHDISFESGKAEIAYAGDTPWHGLGTRVEGLQTAQAMLAAAGLEWTVSARALYRIVVPIDYRNVDGYVGIARDDTDRLLGVVSDRYQIIQNAQAADVVDAIMTEGGAHVEVAGALGHGERCWMLAHVPGDFEVVKGDVIRPYFLLAWGHDGKHGLAGKLTPVRVVCSNTLAAAGFGGGRWSQAADFYVRHYGNAKLNIGEARRALGLVAKQVESTANAYRALASTPVLRKWARSYFEGLFPAPSKEETPEYREKLERWEARQAELLATYAAEQPAGTAWAAYNAVTAWTDHTYPVLKSGVVSAARQESVLFGSYADVKRRAFDSILSLVAVA